MALDWGLIYLLMDLPLIFKGKLHWHPRYLVKLDSLHHIFTNDTPLQNSKSSSHSTPKMEWSVNYFRVQCQLFWSEVLIILKILERSVICWKYDVASLFFFFFIIMIEFKSMASAHDGCSYYQAKTPIDFWCRRDLNPGPLLDDKRLYQLS